MFATFLCPGCGHVVRALAGVQVMHECPKRKFRLSLYKRQLPAPVPEPTTDGGVSPYGP